MSRVGNSRYYTPTNEAQGRSSMSRTLSQTAGSPSSATGSSSKAVLAALRALQDKIRRLEAEKSQAQEEIKQLKFQIQSQELEFDHVKQKEKLNLYKELNETKSEYDALVAERNELELRVSKLEERNKDIRLHTEDLIEKVRTLESEKHQSDIKCKECESKYLQMEVLLDRFQKRENELAASLTKESRNLEEERSELLGKLQHAQNDLNSILVEKESFDKRLLELDELVVQLLNLNEVLLSKLSDSEASKHSLRRILGIHRRHVHSSTESSRSRSRSVPRSAKDSATKSTGGAIDEEDDLLRLNTLHKMYKGLAKALMDSQAILPPSYKTKAPPHEGSNGPSNSANTWKKTSSKALFDATQNSRHSFDYPIMPLTGSRDATSLLLQSHPRLKPPLFASYDELDYSSIRSPLLRSPIREAPPINNGGSDSLAAGKTGDYFSNFKNPPASVNKVIVALEEEYEALSAKYRRLLLSMQNDPAVTDPAVPINGNSEKLMSIITQLQRKGEQLRALKYPNNLS